MAILAECPVCRRKQKTKNKACACGEDLDQAKRSKRVRYWVAYRLPGGKQRRELVGTSIEEARDAEGKRRGQKREGRIFDMLPETKMTFMELTDWYLGLPSIQNLGCYQRYKIALDRFNGFLGGRMLNTIRPIDIESYQIRRGKEGIAAATVDMEVTIAKAMVTKAFDNDMVDGRILKSFRKVPRKLKRGSNARDRILTFEEYLSLCQASLPHLRAIIITALNTGMRRGELLNLQWSHIDRDKWFIRLPASMTKERKAKRIPINETVRDILAKLPRSFQHDYVFTYNGKPIGVEFRGAFKTACKNAKIRYGLKEEDGLRFHDIRTTVKTNMLRAGVDKALRDTILGHSLTGMDLFYIKPTDDDLRKAIDQYSKWLDLQIANVDQSVDQQATA